MVGGLGVGDTRIRKLQNTSRQAHGEKIRKEQGRAGPGTNTHEAEHEERVRSQEGDTLCIRQQRGRQRSLQARLPQTDTEEQAHLATASVHTQGRSQ